MTAASRRLLLAAPVLALLLAPAGIAAQTVAGDGTGQPSAGVAQTADGCPKGFACVPLGDDILELDLRFPSVCVVTTVRDVRTVSVDGERETTEAFCTEYRRAGGTFEPFGDESALRPEQAVDADFGEILVWRFFAEQG